jgi:hypothetical protein
VKLFKRWGKRSTNVFNKKIYHIITTKNILKKEENIHVIMKAKVTNSKILHGSHSLYVVLTWVT